MQQLGMPFELEIMVDGIQNVCCLIVAPKIYPSGGQWMVNCQRRSGLNAALVHSSGEPVNEAPRKL